MSLRKVKLCLQDLAFKARQRVNRFKGGRFYPETVEASGELHETGEFLIGTLSGLLWSNGKDVNRLLRGRVYGVGIDSSKAYAHWVPEGGWAAGWGVPEGKIIEFPIGEKSKDARFQVVAAPLSNEVHQISTNGDLVYICRYGEQLSSNLQESIATLGSIGLSLSSRQIGRWEGLIELCSSKFGKFDAVWDCISISQPDNEDWEA